METVEITINDKSVRVIKGTTLLSACRENNIHIPTLCYHENLPPFAGCRLCLVEVRAGNGYKLVASCEYPVRKPEAFYTHSEKVLKSRRMTAALLVARAPESRETLERILQEPVKSRFEKLESANERCVMCGLCYRFCEQQGTLAIYAMGRGEQKTISTPYGEANDACIMCGACAAVCPTGAIATRDTEASREIWFQQTDLEACPICGKRHVPAKMVDFLRQKTDLPENELRLCPECRRTVLAKKMLTFT